MSVFLKERLILLKDTYSYPKGTIKTRRIWLEAFGMTNKELDNLIKEGNVLVNKRIYKNIEKVSENTGTSTIITTSRRMF